MRWLLALAAALACQGCGLAFYAGPGLLDVDVVDAPPGTRVVLTGLDNDFSRELPAHARQIAIPRGSSYAVGVTAPGHRPALELVRKQMSPFTYVDGAIVVASLPTLAYALLTLNTQLIYAGVGLYVLGGSAYMLEHVTNTDSTFDRLDVKVKLEPRP